MPTGDYRLAVTRNGKTGTYSAGLLIQPAPQPFSVALPASISNGSPGVGAGNLETTASEDDYAFTLASTKAVKLIFSGCASTLGGWVNWKVVNDATGATVGSGSTCGTQQTSALAAATYRVVATRNGKVGTYSLTLQAV